MQIMCMMILYQARNTLQILSPCSWVKCTILYWSIWAVRRWLSLCDNESTLGLHNTCTIIMVVPKFTHLLLSLRGVIEDVVNPQHLCQDGAIAQWVAHCSQPWSYLINIAFIIIEFAASDESEPSNGISSLVERLKIHNGSWYYYYMWPPVIRDYWFHRLVGTRLDRNAAIFKGDQWVAKG